MKEEKYHLTTDSTRLPSDIESVTEGSPGIEVVVLGSLETADVPELCGESVVAASLDTGGAILLAAEDNELAALVEVVVAIVQSFSTQHSSWLSNRRKDLYTSSNIHCSGLPKVQSVPSIFGIQYSHMNN